MKLLGSITSPFVRRVRALLEKEQIGFVFEIINVFSSDGQEILKKYGPLRRVPILIHDDKVIFDSFLICEYILSLNKSYIKFDDKFILKIIDEMTDSAVHLFQLKSMSLDEDCSSKFALNHKSRVVDSLQYLENEVVQIKKGSLAEVWLYCTLDWFKFRNIEDFSSYPKLEKFYISNLENQIFKNSDPRLG